MSEMMEFPDTWEEYEKLYGFNDSEEIYTNNSRLIPSFRVKQWLDNEAKQETKRQATVSSDCIYRQQALDAIRNIIAITGTFDDEILLIDKAQAQTELMMLPSAEPEQEDLIQALETTPSAEPERKIELHGDESAIEILSELRSWFSCFDEKEGLAYHALSLAIRAIKANSTAEPERKKGKWQWCGNHHLCSECDEWALTRWDENECDEVDILTDYCPNCGADMRGEQDEAD